jgi:aminopeptidase YwaD
MHGRCRTAFLTLVVVGLLGAPAARAGTATDEMVTCAAFGPKRPGTAADRAMGDRILERFRAAGLETSAEEFHMPVWKPERTALSIADGPGRGAVLPAESFAYSGTGKLTAEVVDVGAGNPSDFDGKDVRGKVVLVANGGTYHRTVQVENITARGGAAMLYVSASPKNLIQTGAVRWGQRPPASIPAATIGTQTGEALRARLTQGKVTLALEVAGERVDAVTRNVIGIRRGTTYPDRYVVVAGHYDSWHGGANDNCTAVGTLLSTVEANKDQQPAYTMVYVGWGAEEPGLVGSYTWIREHQDLIPKIVLNINLEETASATFQGANPTTLPSVTLASGSTSPGMVALVQAGAITNVLLPPVLIPLAAYRATSGGIIATDTEGFYGQGVQGFTTASTSPYYHTTEDTQDKINLADLERVTSFIQQITRTVQVTPPAALALREVPTVEVTAPKTAAPGAAVPVAIKLTGIDGRPIAGDRVLVLAGQRDNWAVAESVATDLGGGRYRWTLPAGSTDAGITDIRATTATQAYFANGFARIDQRRGGLLTAGSACRSRRVLDLRVPRTLKGGKRVRSLRATTSRGKVRVHTGTRGYTVRLDLRGSAKGAVKVTLRARTNRGTVTQTRTFRTCMKRGS